jgi:hypothetical protein
MSSEQLSFGFESLLSAEQYYYGERSSGGEHGVVLTKNEVVRLMLDLAGYHSNLDLRRKRLIDPACGPGAFVLEAVDRLLASITGREYEPSELQNAILAYDVDVEHIRTTRLAVATRLFQHGFGQRAADKLAAAWITRADFLLAEDAGRFDFIVGNPPYVRIERTPAALQDKYRQRYVSLTDRADLYVAFIEGALKLVSPQGVVVLICPNRWTVNKYGRRLRRMISESFRVHLYIDLHRASPFESNVMAYPAVFMFSHGRTERVKVAELLNASPDECRALAQLVQCDEKTLNGVELTTFDSWFSGDDPWVVSSPKQLSTLRELERRLRPISETARIGVGVATGNDDVFIIDGRTRIESDRLVPIAMRSDLVSGVLMKSSKFVINTFDPKGDLINLAMYPNLLKYFRKHTDVVSARHVAKRNPRAWFRTIDRVYPELVSQPKLLIPDIAGSNEVVFDPGFYLPHHTLYFVTSDLWDMEVLGGLLSSRVALFFVWAYAVKMRGGYIRFQAQYLRRIRLPEPDTLSSALCADIKVAFGKRDFPKLDELALSAYQLQEIPSFDCADVRS